MVFHIETLYVYTEKERDRQRMAQSINEVAGLFGESACCRAPGAVTGMRLDNTGSGLVLVFAILLLCNLLQSSYDSPLSQKK